MTFGLVNAYKTLRSARDQDPVQPQKLFIISASSWTTFFPSPWIEAEEVGCRSEKTENPQINASHYTVLPPTPGAVLLAHPPDIVDASGDQLKLRIIS